MSKGAIVGCGGIGRAHARAYKKIKNVEITAFVDLCFLQAKKMSEEFGGKPYKDIDELPQDIDFASITTPPAVHYIISKRLLERGLGVFCEKPLTMNSNEAEELIEISGKVERPLIVGFKMRFEPIFKRAKELFPKLGKLYGVSTTKIQPYNPRSGIDWVPDVGVMYELSIHEFDLVNWIANLKPKVVYADLRYDFGWKRENKFFLNVDYENGVKGQLIGMYTRGCKFYYRDLTIIFLGEKGYLRIERPDRIILHLDEYVTEEINYKSTNAFIEELSNFVNVLAGKDKPLIEPEAGLIATQMVETANLSSRRNKKVYLASY